MSWKLFFTACFKGDEIAVAEDHGPSKRWALRSHRSMTSSFGKLKTAIVGKLLVHKNIFRHKIKCIF